MSACIAGSPVRAASLLSLLVLAMLSVRCGTSGSSTGGGDDAASSSSSSSGGGNSDGGGDAAGDASLLPQDGGLDASHVSGDSGGGDSASLASCLGSVTFRVVQSAGRYCENLPCDFPNLVTILGASASPLTTSRNSNGCVLVDCAGCQGGGCSGACPGAIPLPDGGTEVSWDGTVWTSGGTCGSGNACSVQSCAAAGEYTAHLCAFGGPVDAGACPGPSPSSTPVCVDVPFTYPAQGPVVGTLP